MIAAFEAANPGIKVRVQVDPTQQASLRALRSRSATPDLFRVANFSLPEFVATNSMVPLDDLLKRDNVSETDWLIPLAAATGARGNSTALVGSVETVAQALMDYYDIGVTTFLIRGYDPLEDSIAYGELVTRVRELVAAR